VSGKDLNSIHAPRRFATRTFRFQIKDSVLFTAPAEVNFAIFPLNDDTTPDFEFKKIMTIAGTVISSPSYIGILKLVTPTEKVIDPALAEGLITGKDLWERMFAD
jgi:hypothetical protein